jgi:hypothetical protein
LKEKLRMYLKDQFGFRRRKGTQDAIGTLRIISERTLIIDEELWPCFIAWPANCTKLMQIVMGTSIDCHGRRLLGNFYMDQSIKIRLDQGKTRSVKILS